MKFGICGYGNLGKAVEELLFQSNEKIVGIFSRRQGLSSKFGTPFYPLDEAEKFKGKIDVMIMCGGSQEDLLWQSPLMLKHFDIVDTFDTHARVSEHRQELEKVSREFGHRAIYSCGWDPGLFSVVRTLFANIFDCPATTFWGKGVSQGHSEALRNIKGIKDAIQFTIPNQEVVKLLQKDPIAKVADNDKHSRLCYICLDGTRDVRDIIKEIENTENYFKGQKVFVEVCDMKHIENLKKKMYHKGLVFAGNSTSSAQLQVKMKNNPSFTAQIVIAYAFALPKLRRGVYSVLDIPVGLIGNFDNKKFI